MNGGDFFRPLWLRVGIVIACAGWAALEWANGESGWAMLATGLTGWGVWSFLIAYEPPRGPDSGDSG